ncbi:hypothetical protein SLE2022_091990 [Rubroshorea leprosula]
MIIKGLFRRYRRWNPVHPTYGAFWGMGIGVGCGVGWGPGFGPEVIGYVGAGCGVGFSVGITLVGFGIGLPANCLFEVPYNAIMATRTGASDLLRLSSKNEVGGGWNGIAPYISGMRREASRRLPGFNPRKLLDKRVDFFDLKTTLSVRTKAVQEGFGRFNGRFFGPNKGLKD